MILIPLASSWFCLVFGTMAGMLGLPIAAWPIAITSGVLAFVVAAAMRARPLVWSPTGAAGAAVTVTTVVYMTFLAWPSLYPITAGPDLIHHLSLIHFIQTRQALPDSLVFGQYLGEMTGYPPGSHVIAAIAGSVTGHRGVAVVHVVMAVATAIKAGLLVRILAEVLPAGPSRLPVAVAGGLLILVPHAYLLSPVTHHGFYSQVISEAFAIAMWWALVVWRQSADHRWLVLASMSGVGVVLTWPVFVTVPALTAVVLILARLTDTRRQRIAHLMVGLGPAACVATLFAATRSGSAGILASGGSVLTPAVELFGLPLLLLSAAGLTAAITRPRSYLAVAVFPAVCLLQVAALVALQHQLGATNYYLGFKTMHLLVYGMVTLAGIGLAIIWRAMADLARADWRTQADRAAWVVPVLVVVALLRSDLPRAPLSSPLTSPVQHAGQWARANLPPNCLDYLVPQWVTAYWLHIDVLGNARASARVETDPYDFRRALGPWVATGSMRYAVVEDWDRIPADARDHMRLLATFDTASVVERSDGHGRCSDSTPAIDAVGR